MNATDNIATLTNNEKGLYEGNLTYYVRLIFNASNIHAGYHNLRHMLHVMWACHEGCKFHKDELTPRRMRNLLIAAAFHDYNHRGMKSDDADNIETAVTALGVYLLEEDRPYQDAIVEILRSTQYPHADLGDNISLEQAILRDADMSQCFSPAWIGDIIGGMAEEMGVTPYTRLVQQLTFLEQVTFHSNFGKTTYGGLVEAKKNETIAIIMIVNPF